MPGAVRSPSPPGPLPCHVSCVRVCYLTSQQHCLDCSQHPSNTLPACCTHGAVLGLRTTTATHVALAHGAGSRAHREQSSDPSRCSSTAASLASLQLGSRSAGADSRAHPGTEGQSRRSVYYGAPNARAPGTITCSSCISLSLSQRPRRQALLTTHITAHSGTAAQAARGTCEPQEDQPLSVLLFQITHVWVGGGAASKVTPSIEGMLDSDSPRFKFQLCH